VLEESKPFYRPRAFRAIPESSTNSLADGKHSAYHAPMQRSLFVYVLAIAVVLLGCGHRPETGESIAEVCHPMNNGKLKVVSGYIGASPVMTFCTTTCTLKLRAQRTGESREMGATFMLGTGNNLLEELPKEFTETDIRIKDDTGNPIKGGDVARITGRLSVTTGNGSYSCTIAATKLEKVGNWP
jgi:hypothetical protein